MDDLTISSRRAMLDVLEALGTHRNSVIIVGAHAIYMQVSTPQVPVAPFTRDSDMAIDPAALLDEPLLERVLKGVGFSPANPDYPGTWHRGVDELDLMVPEGVGGGGRRAARIPPHAKNVARKTRGLEGVLIDNDMHSIKSLEPHRDMRTFQVRVAGSAALLISKLYKLHERLSVTHQDRQQDKDAHDIYRILVAADPDDLRERYLRIWNSEVSAHVAGKAIGYLKELFAAGPDSAGSAMAGRTEEGIGNPATVSLQVSILAAQFVKQLPED